MSSEDTKKVAKCPLFWCSELKGGSWRQNQPKTIYFRPHSRSTSADLSTIVLTADLFFFFFWDHHFRRAKSVQKQVVSKEKNGVLFLNFPLENGVLQYKKVFSQPDWPVYTFHVFGRLGFVFRNCPLFGLWKYGTPTQTII